jgi:aminoglycoside phosphotransferase (APT) family kinase protein
VNQHAWQTLIDLPALATWMDEQRLGDGPIQEASPLGGGTQNVLLLFTRAGRDYVLRRPPPHPRASSNDTICREMRVLSALAGSAVPHPAFIAGCPDPAVLGTAFYLMEPVDGFNATVAMPALHAGDASIRHAMGLALVDGIAALGRVDHLAVGLEDFGKAEGFLQRQPARWLSQLESYHAHAGWPGPSGLPGAARIADWLARHTPAHFTPGILHGDYHLANVMFRHDGPRLAAIVDWELATIGDPLLDLGWLLATWPDPAAAAAARSVSVEPWSGFPNAAELIARYRGQSTRDLSAIDWYAVLACFKLGIILEGTHARACAGAATRETGDALHVHAVGLFERAGRWMS